MKTDQKLVDAAKNLLDQGGENAVTLRAIAQAVGLSHNAPYKHFADRRAILEAIAIDDFVYLTKTFEAVRQTRAAPINKLRKALKKFVGYSQNYPARYRLLFDNPEIGASGSEVQTAAFAVFTEFAAIVKECQKTGALASLPNAELTGLIYATVHGLIDLHFGGHLRAEKGFSSIPESIELFIKLVIKA